MDAEPDPLPDGVRPAGADLWETLIVPRASMGRPVGTPGSGRLYGAAGASKVNERTSSPL
ncbi:hypothetical protein V7793_04125 [Streptomyces sp. KLMMK]|uniref:hypothetical protein n=1 Tax=Streptomyces sp. KLMMK TaxID=3109353 RepID=UPI002FFEB116